MTQVRHYLDHAATTPMLPVAVEAVGRELGRVGNASSLHGSGRAARRVVEESRETIASCVGARPSEVILTSGGTEADNLAVKGAYWSARRADPARTRLVTSTVEHHAVLDAAGWLAESQGAQLDLVDVDPSGRLDLAAMQASMGPTTALISVIWGNNEVGTLQPIPVVAAAARRAGAVSHSDAVQAVGHVAVDFAASGLDTMTFTAHKLGGPYGVGALLARREVQLTPIQHGGGQERDVRSGTFDVAAVAGFAAAVQHAVGQLAAEEERLRGLKRQLADSVLSLLPEARVNGPDAPAETLPGVLNVAIPGCDAASMLMLLDRAGIDCSAGSACAAGVSQPSHVLTAMGRSESEARSCLRFSLGHSSTAADIAALLAVLPEVVRRARAAGAVTV
ncbi:MAG TPA: cysteine desulfurase family protein [Propionibacteriaceae bacterium]|nr:cysteine desulfurase family protein [Propionibacteriaceae bacterium]